MGKNIFLVTDYKGNFGSKFTATPYRSGFDKDLLKDLFEKKGFDILFMSPSLLKNFNYIELRNEFVLYTSQEDEGLYYKGFLEDFIYSIELSGAVVIPSFSLLRAHENKVFFEMVRKVSASPLMNNFHSSWYGTFEEFCSIKHNLKYPVVLKSFCGSMSRGVYLAKTESEAEKLVRKISGSKDIFLLCWDIIRSYIHKGYIRESWNRNKFIIQQYVPGLLNDYKVLIYGKKYYVLIRGNKTGDFRASGQGNLSFIRDLPPGLLDFAEECFLLFNTPQASFDIGFNGEEFFLFEAQFVYFGTYTIEFSEFYFSKYGDIWISFDRKSVLEEEYVESTVDFINK